MINLDEGVRKAVRHFWLTRDKQSQKQGASSGKRNAGHRTAVTDGKHMNGFVKMCSDLLIESGITSAELTWIRKTELPGFYRAEKKWDLVAVVKGQLLAIIEFKTQVGPSFGTNFNNRTEEALGNAADLWAAYRKGAFRITQRPWLGFVFLLEDCEKSQTAVRVKAPHYPVFPEFQGASYAKRYELLLTKLLRDRMYDGTCLLLSDAAAGRKGQFVSPSVEISFRAFATGLMAHATAFAKLNS